MDEHLTDFGLSKAVFLILQSMFAKYPSVERVVIFGSRAKGNYRAGSDIDLVVIAPTMSQSDFALLRSDLDDTSILFKMDLIHWDALSNQLLKSKIMAEGVAFYLTSGQ